MRLGKQPKKSRSAIPAGHQGKPKNISDVTVVGQVSLDLIKSVYEPLIKEVAAKAMEDYAIRVSEYQDAISGEQESRAEMQSDGSVATNLLTEPSEPLFSSTHILNDFLETLADEGKIGWEFQAEGFVQSTHYSMEDVDPKTDLPVIQVGKL